MQKKEQSSDPKGSPNEKAEKDPAPKQSIVLMKKGDYSIHVLIEEVKNLVSLDADHLPYPVIKITAFDKSQRSEKPKEPCASYSINEHCYFEQINLTVEQLDSMKITIEAYDSNHCSKRSEYFGIYEYDLEYIYNQPHHALQNFWLALANPESDDMTKVRGFLKISISVLHDSDPRVELKINPDSNECMIPSQIKMQYKMISLHFFCAENLPNMDTGNKKVNKECDGFIEVSYWGLKKKTQIVSMKTDKIFWNEIVDIPVSVPVVSQKIVLWIKDYDKLSKDDIIGSIELSVNDILNGQYSDFKFLPIYGAPENESGEFFDWMNNNAEIGSSWNGRLLMKATFANSDTPAAKTRPITDKDLIKASENYPRNVLWSVYAKVYGAYYLPEDAGKYSIDISIADSHLKFWAKTAFHGSIEWNKLEKMSVHFAEKDIEDIGDVFIYWKNSSGQAICFQRIKAKDFYLNESVMVIKLIPDPCYDKVSDLYKSGLVKVKISIANIAVNTNACFSGMKDGDSDEEIIDDLEQAVLVEDEEKEKGIKKNYYIVANIYMSRYLVSGDSSGNNDPFVKLLCIDKEQETTVKHEVVNGIWNESLYFEGIELDIKNKSTWPIFLLKLMDRDKLSRDDLLGYSYVWLSDSNYAINSKDLVKPKWQQLLLPESNRPQGELLISFYIWDEEHVNLRYEIEAKPETIPYSFEINVLGLRDLKPLSLLPIKKAFIKFDLNSINVGGNEKESIQSIKTQPKDCGTNPTINTVIKFDVKLPKEEVFMPELQCEVFDYLLSGTLNPSLGIFLLNIRRIIRQTNRQIDQDMKIIQKQVGIFLAQGLIKKNITEVPAMKINTNIGLGGKKIKEDIEIDLISNDKEEKDKDQENIIDTSIKPKQPEIIPPDIALRVSMPIKHTQTSVSTKHHNKEELKKIKNESDFFVVLPQYKPFIIPGTKKDSPNYKEYQIEDDSKIPPEDDYFAIGYTGKHKSQVNEKGEAIISEEETNKEITKHYRRIFRQELEKIKGLKLKSPFIKSLLRRGADEDAPDKKGIFAAISDVENKIIKKYKKFSEINANDTIEMKQEKTNKHLPSWTSTMAENLPDDNENEKDKVPNFLKNRRYGKFKAVIRICEKKKMDSYNRTVNEYKASDPNVVQALKNLNKYETLTRNILVKNKVVIRIYILEMKDLARKDIFSESDPYLKIYLGNKLKFNEQKFHHEDSCNCKWYKNYDILSELPGDSSLKLEVWDYDPLFRDELIGHTRIDLEDRYFDENWKNMKYKPIEVRSLRHPDKSSMQGTLYLWLEIFEKKDRLDMEPWQILPEPVTEVEMRLVVWETENMKCLDVEGTSDLYVNVFIDPKDKLSTDVHYRCQTGIGSFNWRIVMNITLPMDNHMLSLHAYDNDIFSSDDFICGGEINLKSLLKIPKDLDVPISFDKKYFDSVDSREKDYYSNIEFMSTTDDPEQKKFWLQCYKDNQKEGRIWCSLEILPKWKAEISKVGKGRSEPNVAPYLPPPFGRFEFSLNPFKMLNQCVGPKYRRKLYCFVCLGCLIVYLCFFIPMIILHLSGELVNPFNWSNLGK